MICHGIPDQRKLQEGDIINIGTSDFSRGRVILHVPPQDVTLYYDGEVISVNSEQTGITVEIPGYHGDLNETYPVGRIDEDSERLIRTARKCLDESIKICKPGALIRDIGKVMWVQNWNLCGLSSQCSDI